MHSDNRDHDTAESNPQKEKHDGDDLQPTIQECQDAIQVPTKMQSDDGDNGNAEGIPEKEKHGGDDFQSTVQEFQDAIQVPTDMECDDADNDNAEEIPEKEKDDGYDLQPTVLQCQDAIQAPTKVQADDTDDENAEEIPEKENDDGDDLQPTVMEYQDVIQVPTKMHSGDVDDENAEEIPEKEKDDRDDSQSTALECQDAIQVPTKMQSDDVDDENAEEIPEKEKDDGDDSQPTAVECQDAIQAPTEVQSDDTDDGNSEGIPVKEKGDGDDSQAEQESQDATESSSGGHKAELMDRADTSEDSEPSSTTTQSTHTSGSDWVFSDFSEEDNRYRDLFTRSPKDTVIVEDSEGSSEYEQRTVARKALIPLSGTKNQEIDTIDLDDSDDSPPTDDEKLMVQETKISTGSTSQNNQNTSNEDNNTNVILSSEIINPKLQLQQRRPIPELIRLPLTVTIEPGSSMTIEIRGFKKIPYFFSPAVWESWFYSLKLEIIKAVQKELELAIMPLIRNSSSTTPRSEKTTKQESSLTPYIPEWIIKHEQELAIQKQRMWNTYYKDLVEDGTLGQQFRYLLKRTNSPTEDELPAKKMKINMPTSSTSESIEGAGSVDESGPSGLNEVEEDKNKEEQGEHIDHQVSFQIKMNQDSVEIDIDFKKQF